MTAVENVVQLQPREEPAQPEILADEFVSARELNPIHRDNAERSRRRLQAEIGELARRNRWEDVLALCYPVDEKCPELVAHQMDAPIRSEAAFALGHLSRFDDAIAELQNFRWTEADVYFWSLKIEGEHKVRYYDADLTLFRAEPSFIIQALHSSDTILHNAGFNRIHFVDRLFRNNDGYFVLNQAMICGLMIWYIS